MSARTRNILLLILLLITLPVLMGAEGGCGGDGEHSGIKKNDSTAEKLEYLGECGIFGCLEGSE